MKSLSRAFMVALTAPGGLPVAMPLTIRFIPALYAAWLRLPVPGNKTGN